MPDRDLWVVLAGTGVATLVEGNCGAADGPELALGRGEVFLLDGTRAFAACHDPNDPLTVVAVHFDGGPPLPSHMRVVPVEFLAGILDRLLRCRLHGDNGAACRWLRAALDELGAARAAQGPASQIRSTDLHALADRIRERPGDDWRVATLADHAGVTPQHLGRVFREFTGHSPKEYVLEARIEAAKAYLRGSSLPIKRIAGELGFHDEFHLSRLFSRRVGMSPSVYRSRTAD
jgi:AraC-like DNA-binding protein